MPKKGRAGHSVETEFKPVGGIKKIVSDFGLKLTNGQRFC